MKDLPYALDEKEVEKLSEKDKKKYSLAIYYCKQENAGGIGGGWVNGHKLLKEMGWTEKTRTVGHRSYITLVKPEINSKRTK